VCFSFSIDNGVSPPPNQDNRRRFLSMYLILDKLKTYLGSNDFTHIEVMDNKDACLDEFVAYNLLDPNVRNLICLDYLSYNAGGVSNSYFRDSRYPSLKSLVCSYPCFFSHYYGWSFHGSGSLTHVSLNLQKEDATTDVWIPDSTFDSSKIVAFESSEVTLVDASAFRCCFELKRVFLPRCTAIHNGGFRNCQKLEYLSIPSIRNIYNLMNDGVTTIGVGDMTIANTPLLKYLVLPLDYAEISERVAHDELGELVRYITQNSGTVKTIIDLDLENYIRTNAPRGICEVSVLDIDACANDISHLVRTTVSGSSEMSVMSFQDITFDFVNGLPENFSFPNTNSDSYFHFFHSLPLLDSNIDIGDDFIDATLERMGVRLSSAIPDSIARYKTSLINDINSQITNNFTTNQEKIGTTLFNFANNTDRVVITNDNQGGLKGTLSMMAGDKIKFLIRLIAGNGITYDKSYSIVCSLV
jgi:hypothetical protein